MDVSVKELMHDLGWESVCSGSGARVAPGLPLASYGAAVRIEGRLKAEGKGRRTVGLEVSQAAHGLLHGRPVAGRDPPERDVDALEPLEPIPSLAHNRRVGGPEDIGPQRLQTSPD